MTDTAGTEEMITARLVRLDVSLGSDKAEVIRALAAQVAEAGRTQDAAQLARDALAREAQSATGLPGGIAIPHCRTAAVEVPTLAFARLSPGTDFGAKDGPADLAFLIAAPAGGDATHLKVLTQLARALVKKGFTDGLREAATPDEVVELVNDVVALPAPSRPKPASGTPQPTQGATASGSSSNGTSNGTAPVPSSTGDAATEQMITAGLVRLDVSYGSDKTEVIHALAAQVAEAGRTHDPDRLTQDALAREAQSATGLPGGIAIPHCRTEAVEVPTLAFARLSPGTDFGAKDGPADLAFLIAAPAGGDATHLKVLTQLARALVKKNFTDGLREAATPDEVVELVNDVVALPAPSRPMPASGTPHPTQGTTPTGASADNPSAVPAPAAAASADSDGHAAPAGRRSIVAVTACPTGIAHTYMAAEALEAAAARAGVDIAVETQGSAGTTPLPGDVIARADAAIFAVDVGVRDKARFAGKPLVASGVKRPMDDADSMIAEALRYADDPNAPRVEGGGGGSGADAGASRGGGGGESGGARPR
ncbi:MAG: fructose system or component, partial [Nocardioidaceae bacterium]|nr:fructose system or component [Nocardioidaceae bacterium]